MENSSIQVSNIISWIISVAALVVASISLYLQRRDRKPRLNLRIDRNKQTLATGEISEYGGSVTAELDAIEIHAGNPTDRTINIDRIQFVRTGLDPVTVPLARVISTIPPHEKRHAIVVASQLSMLLGSQKQGSFALIDALGYEHRTKAVTV